MFVGIISFNGDDTSFVQSGSYKIADKGTTNCAEGSSIVRNEDECRISAAVLDMPFETVNCSDTEIAGCFANGPDIFFSSNPKNCKPQLWTEKNRNKALAAVCKGEHLK